MNLKKDADNLAVILNSCASGDRLLELMLEWRMELVKASPEEAVLVAPDGETVTLMPHDLWTHAADGMTTEGHGWLRLRGW